MFLVILSYKCDRSEIDKHIDEHVDWLNRNYRDGVFVVSGRRVPLVGGVIVAKSTDRERLEKVLNADPFKRHDLADYEIIEFDATRAHPDFAGLLSR